MQDQAIRVTTELLCGLINQAGSMVHRFGFMHSPASDLAAPDVLNEIQVVKRTADRSSQIGDVPGQDFAGTLSRVFTWPGRGGWPTGLPMMERIFFVQNALERGLRGQIAALVCELRHQLFW